MKNTVYFDDICKDIYLSSTRYHALDDGDTVYLPENNSTAIDSRYDSELTFYGDNGNDRMYGGGKNNIGNFDDKIDGGDGDDLLWGGDGKDTLDGRWLHLW